MREYKLYCIGIDGLVEKRHAVYANDDLDALDRARGLTCSKPAALVKAKWRLDSPLYHSILH